MVGREKEMDRIELAVLKVINGEGSIVNVFGEPGIGKSRLMAELKRRDTIRRTKVLEGRALAIGSNFSFHPLIDILKNWSRIKEKDSEQESIEKLEKSVNAIYPEGVGEVFPFLATLMGMKLKGKYAERISGIEGEALEKLMLKNLREFIIKAALKNTKKYTPTERKRFGC